MKTRHFLSAFALLGLIFSAPLTSAADGDLSITSSNVWFSTTSYMEGSTIRIWASVQNNSGNDLLGSVHFTANGAQIGADQPISALAGKTDDVFVDWVPKTYGSYTIVATIDPWDNNADNPNNNVASKSVYVEQDTDRDSFPNSVDQDDDGDGTGDVIDAFPLNNKETTDTDGDGIGDNEDTDDDNDGTLDLADDLPLDPNYTHDTDKDGTPDETDDDRDGDGLTNDQEDDLGTDPLLVDTDGDKVNDATDAFPTDATEWADTDKDGTGDNSDEDIDGDEIANTEDPNPSNPSPVAEIDQNVIIANVGETVTFDASHSQDDSGIVQYIWTFNNDPLDTADGATVTRTFNEKGVQTATLTVFDENGQSDSTQVNIHVFDYAFIMKAMSFSLLLLLLAFYLVYRYNRRALRSEKAKSTPKPAVKSTTKKASKKRK